MCLCVCMCVSRYNKGADSCPIGWRRRSCALKVGVQTQSALVKRHVVVANCLLLTCSSLSLTSLLYFTYCMLWPLPPLLPAARRVVSRVCVAKATSAARLGATYTCSCIGAYVFLLPSMQHCSLEITFMCAHKYVFVCIARKGRSKVYRIICCRCFLLEISVYRLKATKRCVFKRKNGFIADSCSCVELGD